MLYHELGNAIKNDGFLKNKKKRREKCNRVLKQTFTKGETEMIFFN